MNPFVKEGNNKHEYDSPPPSYNETIKVCYSNSVDFLNANDSLFFDGSNIDLDGDFEYSKEGIESESAIIIQHDEYIRNKLKHSYPLFYVVIDSVLMFLLNVALIILQIVAIKYNAALSYIGSAIWAGTYNLITVVLVFLTIIYRNPTLMMVATTMKLFGMIISFGGFVLVNIVAFYHYNCLAVSYYRPCYNKSMKPVHYTMISLGIPCMILSIAFFVYFQFKLMSRLKLNQVKSNQHIETN